MLEAGQNTLSPFIKDHVLDWRLNSFFDYLEINKFRFIKATDVASYGHFRFAIL